MPCSCDGYDRPDHSAKDIEHERKSKCRAQSLAHKLAKVLESRGGEGVPVDLRDAVERERRELLQHKRAESREDEAAVLRERTQICTNMHEITRRGGIIPEHMVRSAEDLAERADRIRNISDAELLG